MDLQSSRQTVEMPTCSGLTLSREQRLAINTSLLIVKKNYMYSRVLFWGKITGLQGDYFIAKGVTDDEMKEQKYLYSFNCTEWFLLPPAGETALIHLFNVKQFFTGDPSFLYKVSANQEIENAEVSEFTEEQRLIATVQIIDRDVSVVPRGAFIRTNSGKVQMNRSFRGLSTLEACDLHSYLHFSEPRYLPQKSIIQRANLEPHLDFLDPLTEGMSKFWSLQRERSNRVMVVLRSLLWLGFVFFHVPETPLHGYYYLGDGLINLDLPFMM